jgi:hypothetical protein
VENLMIDANAPGRAARPTPTEARGARPGASLWAKVTHLLRPLVAATLASVALAPEPAAAAPEGHILRIDPRASQSEGAPVLTTVLEIVQTKPLNGVVGPCTQLTGNDEYDCIADGMERPKALWESISFPEGGTYLTIKLDDTEAPLTYLSRAKWGDSTNEPGFGTAWLVMIDAAASMGPRFEEAREVAKAFVASMRPNDIINVMYFGDKSVIFQSGWTNDKTRAETFIRDQVTKVGVASGRNRPLGTIIQNGATDGFKELGNVGQSVKVPMHQAMVVLSSGAAGTDPSSLGPGAKFLSQFMTKGRFPEDNTALPKMPVPVISVWFPSRQMEELMENARSFMENMANTDIGGYFTILREGGATRGDRIVKAVRTRFDNMWVVRWQMSCVAASTTQTFALNFRTSGITIAGDGSYQDVPVGIDPTTWPLDIDYQATEEAASKKPLFPGGEVTIYGSFCWSGKKERAELYLLPKNQEVPTTLEGGTLEEAKDAQSQLVKQGLKARVIEANDNSVTFELPSNEKFLAGKGESERTARLVLHDNQTKRTSPIIKDKILTLKAKEKPVNFLLIGGIAFGGVVLVLLIVSAFRSGGRRRGGSAPAAPPPRPTAPPAPSPAAPAPPRPMMPGPSFVQRATLSGPSGIFTVLPGVEMKAGRDGALCQILLSEPRVSGTHASMKIESGQLYVRDDNSNNGTTLNGTRLNPGVWTMIPNGSSLKFGPIEFSVSLE